MALSKSGFNVLARFTTPVVAETLDAELDSIVSGLTTSLTGSEEAAPASSGTATLVAGTVTVADTRITANSQIALQEKTLHGTPGALYVSAKTAGTGFTISSTSSTDTSVVAYQVIAY